MKYLNLVLKLKEIQTRQTRAYYIYVEFLQDDFYGMESIDVPIHKVIGVVFAAFMHRFSFGVKLRISVRYVGLTSRTASDLRNLP